MPLKPPSKLGGDTQPPGQGINPGAGASGSGAATGPTPPPAGDPPPAHPDNRSGGGQGVLAVRKRGVANGYSPAMYGGLPNGGALSARGPAYPQPGGGTPPHQLPVQGVQYGPSAAPEQLLGGVEIEAALARAFEEALRGNPDALEAVVRSNFGDIATFANAMGTRMQTAHNAQAQEITLGVQRAEAALHHGGVEAALARQRTQDLFPLLVNQYLERLPEDKRQQIRAALDRIVQQQVALQRVEADRAAMSIEAADATFRLEARVARSEAQAGLRERMAAARERIAQAKIQAMQARWSIPRNRNLKYAAMILGPYFLLCTGGFFMQASNPWLGAANNMDLITSGDLQKTYYGFTYGPWYRVSKWFTRSPNVWNGMDELDPTTRTFDTRLDARLVGARNSMVNVPLNGSHDGTLCAWTTPSGSRIRLHLSGDTPRSVSNVTSVVSEKAGAPSPTGLPALSGVSALPALAPVACG